MEESGNKIAEIAHGYTQRMIEVSGTDKLIGRMFWNAAEIASTGSSAACKLLRIESDQAVLDDRSQEVPREVFWPIKDLMYGKAVHEAKGFVAFMPFMSAEGAIDLMVSPDGHGYGYLIGDDSL